MKKILYISISIVAIIIAISLLIATSEQDNAFLEKISEIVGLKSNNLLTNADFKEGLKGWRRDENVTLQETNGTKYVCINNVGKGQARIWQNINVVSGKTYRLSFKVTSPHDGAFTILRNVKTGKETYNWCNGINNNQKYVLTIKSKSTGNEEIYFSTLQKGNYCFCDISIEQCNVFLTLLYRTIAFSLLLLALSFLIIFAFSFKSFLLDLFKKYIKTCILILSILISLYLLGINYFIIFIVWCLFFSGLHYLLYHEAKCPETLAPPVALSSIIIVLNISGLFGSLHYGFYLLLILGILGLISMLIRERTKFISALIYQPNAILIYYLLALVLLIQAVKVGDCVRHVDDVHHWMLIIKGMGYYHEISNFPRLDCFDHYTIGSALWGYFINRLSGHPFSFSITNWSNTLISAACFIPGLSIVKIDKKNIPLISVFSLLVAYILILFPSTLFKSLGAALIILALVLIPKNGKAYVQVAVLISYFLLYSFTLITPGYFLSDYRNLPPDIIIYTISIAALLAYLIKPNLKTILYICPLLAVAYLLKKPGLFFSITVGTSIIIHYVILRGKSFWKLIFKKRFKLCYVLIFSLVALVCSLAVPPLVWSKHCKNLKTDFNPYTKFSDIKKCFVEKEDPQYTQTRKNFLFKIKNENLFIIDFEKNKPLSLLTPILRKCEFSLVKNFYVLLVFQIISALLLVFISNNKYKLHWIISLTLFIFAIIFIVSLYVNYCLWFGEGSEKQIIPAFQRYIAPIWKLLLIEISVLFFLYFTKSQNILSRILLVFFLILIIPFSLIADNNLHIVRRSYESSIISQIRNLPPSIDFTNKKMKVIHSGESNLIQVNDLGFLLLNLKSSYPRWADIFDYKSPIVAKREPFDLYLIIRTLFNDDITYRSDELYKSYKINPELVINNTCLFERNNKNQFKLIYTNAVNNIISNGCFTNGFNSWKHGKKVMIESINGTNYAVLSSGGNGYISKKLPIKSNHYYRIIANTINANTSKAIGKIGDTFIYPKSSKKVDFFFISNKDEEKLFIFNPLEGKDIYINDIQFIDLN